MKNFLLLFVFFSSFVSAEEKKPYTVFLKPGTVLTRLSDKTNVVIDKGIYAKVLETNYKKRDLFYVYDKSGAAKYETTAEGITEFDSDIRLLPVHQADVVYPAPGKLQLSDNSLYLDSSFNIHFDNLKTTEFNAIYSDNLESVVATRFELRTIYTHLDYPVKIGANVNYQRTSWQNDVDTVNLSILSYGPLFQYEFYKDDSVSVSALLGAEFSPIYRTSSGESTDRYKALLYDFGIESVWSTEYGYWNIGSHLRRHNLSLKQSNRSGLNPVVDEIQISSFGVMVGYKHEWDL